MAGIPGQYFRQFGLTVAIAVIFSLVVARLITPMMAAYLMRAKDAEEKHSEDGAIMKGYLRVVRTTTNKCLARLCTDSFLYALCSVVSNSGS